MKIPRGISADQLVHVLQRLGYRLVRQKGSHMRFLHNGPPTHSITVPDHNPLRLGTLHVILTEVAHQRSTTIEDLIRQL